MHAHKIKLRVHAHQDTTEKTIQAINKQVM